MALEHITADTVKIDINGSIYEVPRNDAKAFIAGKTSAKTADRSKPKEQPADTNIKAKKAKKAEEVVEIDEAPKDSELIKQR